MLNLKRLICLLLAAIILSSGMSFANNFDDYSEINLINEAMTLKSMGVIENFDALANWSAITVTRAEVINAVCKLSGFNPEITYTASLPYKDIIPGYENINAVRFAYASGFIDSSEKLELEKNADLNFIVKALTNASGYGIYASAKNSYANTVIYNKLTQNVKASDYLSYNDFIQIMYNTLFIDYLDRITYGGEPDDYKTTDGVSVAGKFLDIYTISGKMESSSIATTTGTYSKGRCVTIDRISYKINDKSLMLLVGHSISGVYQIKDDEPVLLYAFSANEKELCIDADRFISYDNNTLVYENENGKEKNAKTSKNAIIMYNGQNITGSQYSEDLFKIKEGYITLIDSGSGYDLISISSYDNLLVGAMESDYGAYAFYDKQIDKKSVKIDVNEENYIQVKNVDGEVISPSDIKIESLLTYQQSLDGEFISMFVSDNKIEGSITEYSDNSYGTKIVTGGEEYLVTAHIPASMKKLLFGIQYEFYINAFGNIGAVSYITESDYITAYLVDYIYLKEQKKEPITLEVLTTDSEDDEYEYIDCAKKVNIDGERGVEENEKLAEALLAYSKESGSSTFKPMVIRFKKNADGKVTDIDTPYLGKSENTQSLVKRHLLTDDALLVKYMSVSWNAGYTFGLKYYTNKNALHLGYDASAPNDYYLATYPNEKTMNVELYSVGKDTQKCVASVGVAGEDTEKYEDDMALVLSVKKVLNKNEDVVKKIEVIHGGKVLAFETKASATNTIPDVKPGDVVAINLDSQNRLVNIDTSIFDYDSIKAGVRYTGGENYSVNRLTTARYVTGTVYSVEYDEESGLYYLYYFIDNPDNLSILMLRENINYIYEKDRNDDIKYDVLSPAKSQSDIKGYKAFGDDADIVVIRYTYWVPSYSFVARRQ